MPSKKGLTAKDKMRAQGYIPVSEAAQASGMSVWHIYELLDSGKVRGVSIGQGRYARRFIERRALIEHIGLDAAKLLGLVP